MNNKELSWAEDQVRQFREFNRTGARTVDCPKCGAKRSVRTEIDNDYGICAVCGEHVKVGRVI